MLLRGLRVLELGDGLAGRAAGRVLADLGASVTTVTGNEFAGDEIGASRRDLLVRDLDRDKTLIGDLSAVQGERWHVVLHDRVATGAGPLEQFSIAPIAYVLITAFGSQGVQASWVGSEFVALAAGGGMSVVSDSNGDPVPTAGWQATLSAGHVAALAALDGINVSRARGGESVVVDVSMRDAVVFTFTYLECAHGLLHCPGSSGGRRYTAPSGIFQTEDGRVRLAAVDDHQWNGAKLAFGNPAWALEYTSVEDRRDRAARLTAQVDAWTRTRKKAEVAELLQRHGVPSTPVNTPAEVLDSLQLRQRGFFTETNGEPSHRPPFLLDLSAEPVHDPATFWDSGTGVSMAALSVVEATHVVSAPIAGALVGGMGARIVRIEDVDRLDMYRRIGPFADGIPGLENGAYFLASNVNKESLAFRANDLSAVQEVTDRCDMVLENVRPKRLERWNLDLAQLSAGGRLTLSLSGFGRTGPLADYRAYANNIHAYAGLTDTTRTRDGGYADVYTVLADIATSLMTAIVTSAWTLGPYFRSGADADVAMLEVLVARLADQLLAAHFGDNSDVTWSTREPNAVPNDIYAALGGPVAVTVRDDHAWGVLSEAVGLREPRWNTLQARTSDAAALRAALTDHIGRLNRDELVARLQAGGVPAAPVLHPVDSYTDETLRERGLFRKLKHEERGSYWTLCQPWRIVGGDDRTWTAAPVLGSWNKAHNVAIPSLPDQP